MAEFFDHPDTGALWFRAPAGGTGGGATSVYEGPAKKEDIAANNKAHARYLFAKRQANVARAQSAAASELRETALEKAEEAVNAAHAVVLGEAAQDTSGT